MEEHLLRIRRSERASEVAPYPSREKRLNVRSVVILVVLVGRVALQVRINLVENYVDRSRLYCRSVSETFEKVLLIRRIVRRYVRVFVSVKVCRVVLRRSWRGIAYDHYVLSDVIYRSSIVYRIDLQLLYSRSRR